MDETHMASVRGIFNKTPDSANLRPKNKSPGGEGLCVPGDIRSGH
jgi:hypothetical protein